MKTTRLSLIFFSLRKVLLIIGIVFYAALFSNIRAQEYSEDDVATLKNIALTTFTEETSLNWLTESDPASWDGVNWTTIGNTEYVYELSISSEDIKGYLDVSELTYLEELNARYNKELTSVNVQGLLKLNYLALCGTSISHLDVSGLTVLETVECGESKLETINTQGCISLNYLYIPKNNLAKLDVKHLSSLIELRCQSNQLITLDLSGMKYLSEVKCQGNAIESLDASGAISLESLYCQENNLTDGSLNLNGCDNLYYLTLSKNNFRNLDLTHLKSLEYFYSSNMGLETLNITGLTQLSELRLEKNNLDTFDVTGCINLSSIDADYNKLLLSDIIPLDDSISTNYSYQVHRVGIMTGESIDYSGEVKIGNTGTSTDTTIFSLVDENGITITTNKTGLFTIDSAGYYTINMDNNGYNMDVDVLVAASAPNAGDLAILQTIIDSNFTDLTGLNWGDNVSPLIWDGVTWNTQGRVMTLDISNHKEAGLASNLTGDVSISGLDSLTYFSVTGNGNVTGLNVAGLDTLNELYCSHTAIKTLDLSGLINLKYLYASKTPVTDIDFSGCDTLYEVKVNNTKLKNLDLSDITSLYRVEASYCGNMDSIDVSGCTNLYMLYVNGENNKGVYNTVKVIDASGAIELDYLYANNCYDLNYINASGCVDLRSFYAYYCNLDSVNVSGCTDLMHFYVYNNPNLEKINVSGCTNLYYLEAYNCNLNDSITGLSDAKNRLYQINVNNNQLTSLDLTTFTNLYRVNAENNKLPLSQTAPIYNNATISTKYLSNQTPYEPLFISVGDTVFYPGEDSIMINGVNVPTVFELYTLAGSLVSTQTGIDTIKISTAGEYYVYMSNSSMTARQDIYVGDSAIIEVAMQMEHFGSADIGSSKTGVLTISNNGNNNLNVSNITLPEGFSVATSTYTIPAGTQQDVDVTFTPVEAIGYGGNIVVSCNTTWGDSVAFVRGVGIERTAAVSGDLAIGGVVVGETGTGVFTITNTGNDVLSISNITLPEGFSVSNTALIVGVTEMVDVEVTFSPDNATEYSGDITITSDATTTVSTVAVSGTGLGSTIELTGNLAFDDIAIGESTYAILTISNNGTEQLDIASITLPEGFSASKTTLVVVGGDSKDIVVTFSPTSAENYSGVVTVTCNAISGTNTIDVSGTGVNPTGINDNEMTELAVYPNPTVDVLRIKNSTNMEVNIIEIYNMDGKKLYYDASVNSVNPEINVSEFMHGTYVLRINNNHNIVFTKK